MDNSSSSKRGLQKCTLKVGDRVKVHGHLEGKLIHLDLSANRVEHQARVTLDVGGEWRGFAEDGALEFVHPPLGTDWVWESHQGLHHTWGLIYGTSVKGLVRYSLTNAGELRVSDDHFCKLLPLAYLLLLLTRNNVTISDYTCIDAEPDDSERYSTNGQ